MHKTNVSDLKVNLGADEVHSISCTVNAQATSFL